MMRIIHVPGLVYSGETDAQAFERDKRIEKYNAEMEANEREARQPMKSYRNWAKKRGLTF